TWLPSGKRLLVISVYAPQELRDKKMLWDYLVTIICNWDGEVVTMGDFNEVRDCSERFGSVFNKKGAEVFNNFIVTAGLVVVPLGGCSFTWCHKSAIKMSKLDRFLIFDNLMRTYPTISSISLDRYLSDHRPILMREIHCDYGPTPFKFFHYWFEIDGFDKLVDDSWKEANICDNNDYINLMKKLRFLKEKIRKWNCEYKKSKNCGMRNLKVELNSLDSVIDNGNGTDLVINRRMEVIRLMQEMEKADNLEVAQKAKIKWATEGDENSKYYHGVLDKKISRLTIRGVLADGIWIESPQLVKKEVFLHFKQRFEQSSHLGIRLEMDFVNRLSSDQRDALESEVSNDEVRKAVWDCVKWFFIHGSIPKGGNSTFITLIPKIPNANMVKDFRPISLIGSIYKIVAKILANRLVTVLGGLVNEIQSAFVADRQILDGPFILNEIVHWCKKRNKQAMVFKVDFEKAYYNDMGDSQSISLSINRDPEGSNFLLAVRWEFPTQDFQFCKGLKQGDPLSPFLFILVMESLHISFQRVVDAGFFKGFKLGSSLQVSHLFYAEDAIFMGQWNQSNIDTITRATSKIGCMVLTTPFRYLGSKVGGLMSRIQSWSDIIEGMEARLSRCKLKTLSIGGRLTLIKSVLGAIHIYHMSMFKVPMQVVLGYRVYSRSYVQMGVAVCLPKKSLWARVISALHGDGGKIGKKIMLTYPSIWLSIVQEIDMLKLQDTAFKELAPRVYALETLKGITVAAKLSHGGLDQSLRRRPRGDAERSQLELLQEKIDRIISIDDYILPKGTTKTRWIKEVPIKINIHAWKVKNDCFPTRFNMSRRGMKVDSILCPLCNRTAESSRHLFFSGKFSRDIMVKINRWWEVDHREVDSYEWMSSIRLRIKVKKVFEAIHGVKGAIDSTHKSSKSSLWLDIIREFQNLSNLGANLLSLVITSEITFVGAYKCCSVAVKMKDSSLISSFRRPSRGGVEEDQLRLLEDIISSVVLSHSSDRWIWRLDSSDDFSVKSARNYIDDSFLPTYEAPTRWIGSIPIKVNIFA
nr:hypothetical protein [Tanacetum cinerariifolium]